MKSRTTLILVLVALVIGGVAVLDYYKGTPTEQAEAKRKRVLDIEAGDVTHIEIVRTNQTIVLDKSGDRWEIKQPLAVRASASAVSSVLDDLEFAERTRALSEKDIAATKLADFGLESPRLRVVVRGKKGPMTLLVGNETPTKDALYVRVEGRKGIEVADKSIYDRLNKGLDELRDRIVVDFVPAAATRLEIKSTDRVIELTKPAATTNTEPRWAIVRPLAARADQNKVSELLGALGNLRVADFVSDDPKDIHTYQLEEPVHEITVWTGDAGKTLVLGRSPTNDASKVYAKLRSADSIFTVPSAGAEKFTLQVNELRDPRALAFSETDVYGVELLRGTDKIQLAREDQNWRITAPVAVAAEDSLVHQLLVQLAGVTIKQFTADVATDLDKYGLAVPTATVTLQGAATNVLAQLLVGAPDNTQLLRYVKRADEPFIYGVASNLVEWLPVNYLALRTRRLAELTPEQIATLTLRTPAGETKLERNADGKWRLVEPTQGVLDSDGLERLLDAFCQLRAREFLREGQDKLTEYGLDAPEYTLTVVATNKTDTLALGKARDNGQRYASWSEPALLVTVAASDLAPLIKPVVTTGAPASSAATNRPPVEVVTPPVSTPAAVLPPAEVPASAAPAR
jgi:hypothetical protein